MLVSCASHATVCCGNIATPISHANGPAIAAISSTLAEVSADLIRILGMSRIVSVRYTKRPMIMA